jgi:hypothetical protein
VKGYFVKNNFKNQRNRESVLQFLDIVYAGAQIAEIFYNCKKIQETSLQIEHFDGDSNPRSSFLETKAAAEQRNRTKHGCQMLYFQTKNRNFDLLLRALECKIFGILYLWPFCIFKAVWCILCCFGRFCGPLVYISQFWHFVPRKIWQPWY